MKSFFKILTFLIFLIIILVAVGVMWDTSPIATAYKSISDYTNYIIWLFAIIGGIAIFLDLKNIKKIVLALFLVSILAMVGHLFISINDLNEVFDSFTNSPLELIKDGPFLFIALHVVVPVSLILGPEFVGTDLPLAFTIITALFSVFTLISCVLLLTTRAINNMSKAARTFYLIAIIAVIALNGVLFVKSRSGLDNLDKDFLKALPNLLTVAVTASFFSFIAFFTSNYGFDSILEDVSMDEADSIINKNVKDLYTHPTATAPQVQPASSPQVAPMNISNIPAPINNQAVPSNAVPTQAPVFEDNPLPFATAQVKKSDVPNTNSEQINQ